MTFVATTVNNQEIYLDKSVSLVIESEESVPADTLAVIFAVDRRFDEFKFLKMYYKDKLVFNGIVDNHTFIFDENGQYLKLNVRSMSAVLLDNEAMPQSYILPSINTIFRRHVKPYGFLGIVGENSTTAQEYTVFKGMSEWDVLYKFCTEVLDTIPRITVDNYIDISQDNSNVVDILKVGNSSYCIEEDINRYNLISDIYVRLENDSTYSEVIRDDGAIAKGVVRKRYLNLVGNSNPTLSYGEARLKVCKQKSYKIKLQVQGYVDVRVGMRVELNDKTLGKISGLVISKIKYRLGSNRDNTEITLRRE